MTNGEFNVIWFLIKLKIFVSAASIIPMIEPPIISKSAVDPDVAAEIKEFHFHVYFYQNNNQSVQSAMRLRDRIFALTDQGFFHPVPLSTVNMGPRGPHTIGSYEVWCPKEHFSRTYSWFLLNRDDLSVLVHPLTKYEVLDHTERAVWMGKSVPLDLSALENELPAVPAQYPELHMGYSAPS